MARLVEKRENRWRGWAWAAEVECRSYLGRGCDTVGRLAESEYTWAGDAHQRTVACTSRGRTNGAKQGWIVHSRRERGTKYG